MATFGAIRGGATGGGFHELAAGLGRLVKDLKEEFDDVLDDVEDVLWNELDRTILQPANEIVPFDTGALHDSGYINVTRSRGRVQGMVGYDTDYAIYVHERLDCYHKPPTRAKWLEETFALRGGELLDNVEAEVRARQE